MLFYLRDSPCSSTYLLSSRSLLLFLGHLCSFIPPHVPFSTWIRSQNRSRRRNTYSQSKWSSTELAITINILIHPHFSLCNQDLPFQTSIILCGSIDIIRRRTLAQTSSSNSQHLVPKSNRSPPSLGTYILFNKHPWRLSCVCWWPERDSASNYCVHAISRRRRCRGLTDKPRPCIHVRIIKSQLHQIFLRTISFSPQFALEFVAG